MPGIPFIGENGFYPSWVIRDGRWIFQRTLSSVGGMMEGLAELVAARTPGADQVIVWVPRTTHLRALRQGALHEERDDAIRQLCSLALRCYGDDCTVARSSAQQVRSLVDERGIPPEQWRLQCPKCGGVVGPDLEPVAPYPLITKWLSLRRPPLENPAASAAFKSAAAVVDLPGWIARNDPSHLELAYLGQQLWPTIEDMLTEFQRHDT